VRCGDDAGFELWIWGRDVHSHYMQPDCLSSAGVEIETFLLWPLWLDGASIVWCDETSSAFKGLAGPCLQVECRGAYRRLCRCRRSWRVL